MANFVEDRFVRRRMMLAVILSARARLAPDLAEVVTWVRAEIFIRLVRTANAQLNNKIWYLIRPNDKALGLSGCNLG